MIRFGLKVAWKKLLPEYDQDARFACQYNSERVMWCVLITVLVSQKSEEKTL